MSSQTAFMYLGEPIEFDKTEKIDALKKRTAGYAHHRGSVSADRTAEETFI